MNGANCEVLTIYCLHNFDFVHILSSLVKQKRILFVLDGWGQRVPGQIKGSRLRHTFGRGDNRAQLLLPEGQRCPSAPGSPPNLLRVFLDADPGTVRGITCPSV